MLGWRHEFRARANFVNQAKAIGLLSGDLLARQQQAHRLFERDLLGQPMHSTGPGDQTHSWFRQAEARMFCGNDEITGERNLKASSNGHAIDGSNDGLITLQSDDATEVDRSIRLSLPDHALAPGGRR